MIRLRVKEILKEKGVSKYWLFKQMDMSYQNFKRMIDNETKSIKYSNLEVLCNILECTPDKLFDYNLDLK